MRLGGRLGMLALAGAASGCGGQTFSCSDDSGCGDGGRCEADGWCSFADAECPSGRRYAEFSGGGVAGSCVDRMSQASSTGDPGSQGSTSSGTTGSSSSSNPVTTLTEGTSSTPVESDGSTTTTSDDGSTTCAGGVCGTTMSTGSVMSTGAAEASSEETGDPMPPCEGFYDDFGDGALDPSWQPYGAAGMGGHVMEEVSDELRWDFVSGIVEQRGLFRLLDAPVSTIRVHATDTAILDGAQAQTVMLFRENGGPGDLFLVWSNDNIQVRDDGVPVADSSSFEWVEVRFEADEVLVFTSANGVDFELLTSVAEDYGGGGQQTVWLYGQTWTQAPAAASAAFGSIRVCEP